jgi:hypothetical protein
MSWLEVALQQRVYLLAERVLNSGLLWSELVECLTLAGWLRVLNSGSMTGEEHWR